MGADRFQKKVAFFLFLGGFLGGEWFTNVSTFAPSEMTVLIASTVGDASVLTTHSANKTIHASCLKEVNRVCWLIAKNKSIYRDVVSLTLH